MAKEKKSTDTPTPKKTAAKKSAAKKAAPSESAAQEIAATAPVSSPELSPGPVRTAQPSPAELYDQIRRRAFELYRERGGEHGSHEADWHRAETEVRSRYKA